MRKTPVVPHTFIRQLEQRQRQILARLDALAWVRPAQALAVQEQRAIDALLALYEGTSQEERR
jgi:hypothetical protein